MSLTRERRDCVSYEADVSIVPNGTSDVIDEAIVLWQKRTARKLTREDGREIIENMVGFFSVLREWDNADRVKRRRAKHPS